MNIINFKSDYNSRRLKIFCLIFALLSVYFGLVSSFAREKYMLEEQNRLNKGVDELVSYLGHISDSLSSGLDREAALISGGAKTVVSSLPFCEATKNSLQSFLYSVATMTDDERQQKIVIESYAYYAQKICSDILSLQSSDGRYSIKDIQEIRIDPPPSFAKEDNNASLMEDSYNYGETIAKEKARKFLGNMTIIRRSDPSKGIVRYSNGSAFADISKSSGALIRYCAAGVIGDGVLSFDNSDAIQNASDFLDSLNLSGATLKSYSVSRDRLHAIFKRKDKFIRISVSLENGRVVSFDATDYYLVK